MLVFLIASTIVTADLAGGSPLPQLQHVSSDQVFGQRLYKWTQTAAGRAQGRQRAVIEQDVGSRWTSTQGRARSSREQNAVFWAPSVEFTADSVGSGSGCATAGILSCGVPTPTLHTQ